jgi:dethiobiotin synthetase
LLTIEALQNRKINVAELFLVEKKTKRPNRSFYPKQELNVSVEEQEPYFDQNVIKDYADQFRENLLSL